MTGAPDLRQQISAWGEALVAHAERADDPYLVTTAVKERLAELPAEAPAREVIHDLLIDWIDSEQLARWHPALIVLLDERVVRAAPAIRSAAESAASERKRAETAVFQQVADELEDPPGFEADPAVVARWDAFDAALREASALLPDATGRGVRQSTVEHFLDDFDRTNALFIASAGVERSDGRPEALALAERLIPEFELWLGRASGERLSDRDRVRLEHTLEQLQHVVAAHAAGTAVPPAFRESFARWWEEQADDEHTDVATAIRERLRDLDSQAPERGWIIETLTGWLLSDDARRWKPALAVLRAEREPQAAPEMRFATTVAYSEEKQSAAAAFIAAADAIERGEPKGSL